ncbi:MAG TPA: NIPSNAP family protein [Flavitalea sp.]|nr:NIPSNAP family protein [Flavitalea sp.]
MKQLLMVFLFGLSLTAFGQKKDSRYFEMRTYHGNENKRPDLIRRFQDHTLRLFEKHGIENIAYFIPTDQNNNSLTFILAYPDKASRDVRWNSFANDPEWKEAAKKSEANGALVAKVDQVFMNVAPELSPKIKKSHGKEERIFELRTYYCLPGKVENLNMRFRDHTRKLFEKHGMTNIAYWYSVEKDGTQPRLIYLLGHKNEEAAKASFDSFRNDPEWIKARDASEASGKIVEKSESVYLKALDFSPLK